MHISTLINILKKELECLNELNKSHIDKLTREENAILTSLLKGQISHYSVSAQALNKEFDLGLNIHVNSLQDIVQALKEKEEEIISLRKSQSGVHIQKTNRMSVKATDSIDSHLSHIQFNKRIKLSICTLLERARERTHFKH